MKMSMNFGDLPTFTPNAEKVLAAISFLIEEAEKLGHELTQYEIVKTLFKADERHLNEAGRPVAVAAHLRVSLVQAIPLVGGGWRERLVEARPACGTTTT